MSGKQRGNLLAMNDESPLSILYRDDHLIAVDKPAGLLVHRTRIADAHAAALQRVRDQVGQRINPVHRLDRPTSGVLLFAFSSAATRALQETFDRGEVTKRYLALVRGYLEDNGTIAKPLRQARHKPERPATTHYRCLHRAEAAFPAGPYDRARYSLAMAEPATGRLHQIRRHFRHLRHPILGDTTHGDGHQNRAFRTNLDIYRLMLMARTLEFPHPVSGDRLRITAPLPEAFRHACRTLGWPESPDDATPSAAANQTPAENAESCG